MIIKENEKKEKKENNFVFVFDEVEKRENLLLDDFVKKKGENKLIFGYEEETEECDLFQSPIVFQLTYFIYDNYFNDLKFDILNFQFQSIMNIVINIIYYLSLLFNENNLAKFLIESIAIMKKLEKDKKLYISNNCINNQNNIINDEEKDNENKKDDDNKNNETNNNNEDIKMETNN